MALPGPGEWGWTGEAAQLDWNYGADPGAKDYALAYAAQRQAGLPHERAVLRAQMETKGFRDDLARLVEQHGIKGVLMGRQILRDDRRFSLNPYPANARNEEWAAQPLSSPLPIRQQLEQTVAQAAAAPMPKAPSSGTPDGWRRMAGRWGLPALAALGGFTALAAATGVEQPREQQQQPV